MGAPHDTLGEVPVAFVAAFPEATLDADALTELCRANLTKVKVPVEIHVLDSLPKNPVGKIDKPVIRTLQPAQARRGS